MIKYSSSIIVASKSFSAEEIAEILNIKYDEKREIGQSRSKTILKYTENLWILKSGINPSLPLSNHIEHLIERIIPNMKNFLSLENSCEVVCRCIIEGDEEDGYPEVYFPPDLLKKLSLMNAALDVDLYI